MKNLLGKHLFVTHTLSWPKGGIYRVLRRINRETSSQYISDVQRVGTRADWNTKVWFQKIAKRFLKNKLFNDNGTLSYYYGSTTLIDGDFSPMISDTPFSEMFKVVRGNSRDDLFNHEMKMMSKRYSIFSFLHKHPKNEYKLNLHYVCLDTEGFVGIYLKETFGVDVYVVDRMWDDKRFDGGHYDHNYDRSCNFDRNAVIHQITVFGGDKDVISAEEDSNNTTVLIWFFVDRIVYKKESGKREL